MDAKYIKFSVATSSSSLLNGLVSYWKLDETSGTVTDEKGANNGTVTGATQNQTTSKIGKSVLFDASTEKIDCGNTTSLSLTSAGTISAWIYATGDYSGYPVIVSKENWATDRNGYTLAIRNDGYLALELADGTSSVHAISSSTVTTNAWHHVVGVWEVSSNTLKVYLDNTAGSNTSLTMTPVTNTYNFKIGNDGAADDANWVGYIDEVGIWNRILTSGEISQLYNSGSGKTYPFS